MEFFDHLMPRLTYMSESCSPQERAGFINLRILSILKPVVEHILQVRASYSAASDPLAGVIEKCMSGMGMSPVVPNPPPPPYVLPAAGGQGLAAQYAAGIMPPPAPRPAPPAQGQQPVQPHPPPQAARARGVGAGGDGGGGPGAGPGRPGRGGGGPRARQTLPQSSENNPTKTPV